MLYGIINHVEMRHKPRASVLEHTHDCWEFILTLKGSGLDVIG